MSDTSQGPGWWQASDGKWYPPEQAAQAPTASPSGTDFGAPTGPPPGYGPPPGAAPAYGAPGAVGYGPPTGPGGSGQGQLAEWGQRVVSTLIDTGIILAGYVVVFILVLIFSAIADALALIVALVGYLILAVGAFYFYYLDGQTGQSPGKRLTGLKVIGEQTGQPIGGGQGVIRGLAHFLDGFCLIGYLFPLWDPKKQTFADKVMKTVVVTGAPKQSFGPDLFKP